jgi:glycosyltransferase involved in cell wall biosynthesis
MTGAVTILIPTYNRSRALRAVWPSYVGNPLVAEIVVVDDGSTDGTDRVVKELAASSPTPVTLIRHAARRGQQAARQTAIAASNTEWVIFGEDDVWLQREYIGTLLRQAGELGASIIAGRLLTARTPGEFRPEELPSTLAPVTPADRLVQWRTLGSDFSLRTSAPTPVPFLHSIALIRRRLFAQCGFDGWFVGNGWREETDFYLSANAAGEKVYFTPDAACFHLRGPICAEGGQRISRLSVEYYAWRNTRYLLRKHWAFLRSAYGLSGGPFLRTLEFFVRRQLQQLRRALTRGVRSSFQA